MLDSTIDSLEASPWAQSRGRPKATFVDNLLIDTGVETTGELYSDTHAGQNGVEKGIQDPHAAPADPP